MTPRARLLDVLLHVGLIGIAGAAASLSGDSIPATVGPLLASTIMIVFLPFRGAWGHYLAGGIDVVAAALAAFALVQAVQLKLASTTVMAVEALLLAYIVLALAAASLIERNRHGRMDIRRAFFERHLNI